MTYITYDDYDDEPPEERPLTEWKKKELRAEVENLRQALDEQAEAARKVRVEHSDLREYVRVNDRHNEMLRRLQEAFDRGGWRIATMDMDVVHPEPEQFTTLTSSIVEHVARAPYATLTVQMTPCPPKPKGAR